RAARLGRRPSRDRRAGGALPRANRPDAPDRRARAGRLPRRSGRGHERAPGGPGHARWPRARQSVGTHAGGPRPGGALAAARRGPGDPMKLSAAALLSGLLLGQSTVTYVRTKTNDNAHCLHWAVMPGTRLSLGFVQSTTGDPTLGAGV